jgi:hypothetical protein
VELLGRYSNHPDQGERIQVLVEMVPSGPPEANLRTPRQVQRRLRRAEIEELVASYQAGGKVNDLAAHYQVNRNTVMGHIERVGVRRHYPALLPEEIRKAAELYRSGRALAAMGVHFGVNASTVRTALLKVGVAMRDYQGRDRWARLTREDCLYATHLNDP